MLNIKLKSEATKESKYFHKDIMKSMSGGSATMYVNGMSFECKIVGQYYFKTDIIAN